jgi:hypothetical protein
LHGRLFDGDVAVARAAMACRIAGSDGFPPDVSSPRKTGDIEETCERFQRLGRRHEETSRRHEETFRRHRGDIEETSRRHRRDMPVTAAGE